LFLGGAAGSRVLGLWGPEDPKFRISGAKEQKKWKGWEKKEMENEIYFGRAF
jgi:hypothetical protein